MSTSLEVRPNAMAIDEALGADAAAHIPYQIKTHAMAGYATETAHWHRIKLALIEPAARPSSKR